ncbi:heme-degrading monooxygenase HmoA [Diaminobutyricimonas aerilata]|uniref:Heme-degrading monooxygenase HmoA n=2 Tax=Diaminobutyricimonas aerilata TaxID=1162967 RepID=A0A2M9CJ62_9MICO|nr:heme-degrading monooxygenase HmoA [Diaminobutyricimonas aerilata]
MRQHGVMILEHAPLTVRPGMEDDFERAFARASAIIASMPGFLDLALARCVERPNGYLLLVHWESVEHHEVGFRGSPEYQEWKALLHHFYDPFPTVEHFETVLTADPR